MPTPTDSSDPAHPDPLIGETLANRYQIEVRLGEGAMGSVYRARHVKVGRPFAVKVLHPQLLADKKVAQRFEREAELAGRLRHPNVIGVVDVGETNDAMRYMVMDFAEGMDLAGLLAEAPMPAARIMNLTRQILEGLFHAHEQGLIHRDFKPENVIVERDAHGHEVPRIVDFGIAILREGGESAGAQGRLTTNGLVLGTPHYMAPEQAVADPIDHRIDLFALGIVVYEMLCGKLPFDGTGAEVARANLLLDPPPISQRVPYLEVDPLLEAFARRMMAKRREARPPTARAAREILDLIERDRAAAAAALGVPLDAPGARAPQVTADAMPQLPPSGPATGSMGTAATISVAAAGAAAIASRDTPPQGPRFEGDALAIAEPDAADDGEKRNLKTSRTDPLSFDDSDEADKPASRRGMLIGVIAALLGAAIAFVIIYKVTSSGGGEPVKTAQITPPVPVDAAAAVVVTPPPPPTPDAGSGSGSAEVPSDGSGSDVAVVDPHPTGHPKHPPVKPPVKGPGSGSASTSEPAIGSAAEPTGPREGITAGAVAALYSSVGHDLETLRGRKGDDALSDVLPRYRLVNLNEAIATSTKRESAYATLIAIQRDIHAKLK